MIYMQGKGERQTERERERERAREREREREREAVFEAYLHGSAYMHPLSLAPVSPSLTIGSLPFRMRELYK